VRPQPVEVPAQEQHERRHLERLRAARLLDRRQRGLVELGVAARAPGQHLLGLAAASLSMVASAKRPEVATSPVRICTTPQQWRGSAHHVIADAERIHDVEGEQRDMRGLEHVAAGVEHEVRRLVRSYLAAKRC
jgi:hypothetical protein